VGAAVRFATVLVLVFSLGLHWAVLRTVAWTGMLLTYSRDGSWKEAVAKTFDGKHPCAVCKVIDKGRGQDQNQKQPQAKPGSKLDPGLVWQAASFRFDRARALNSAVDSRAPSRTDEPPKPRPRGGFDSDHALI
jgi:hypothetical protein